MIDLIIITVIMIFAVIFTLSFAAGTFMRFIDREYSISARAVWLVLSVIGLFVTFRISMIIWRLLS
jgi:hypothetical protein